MPESQIDEMLNTPDMQDVESIVADVLADGSFDPRAEVAKVFPYANSVRVSDIVPEEDQMALMQLDQTLSDCYWMIGDIADKLIKSVNRQRAQELGKVITNVDIFDAVGYFCHRTGRTVRYYWVTASYFPPEMRREYDVSFTMWTIARWVGEPRDFLQIAVDNPQMSVESVRAEYYRRIGKTPPTREKPDGDDVPVQDGGAELPLPVDGEHWTGDAQPRFKNTMIARLDATIDQLRETADRVPIPTDIRTRIADVLLELQDIVLEIRRVG